MSLLLRRLFGLFLAGIGALFSVVIFIGILDPASFQMGNDLDPYGTPPSRLNMTMGFLITFAITLTGLRLTFAPKRHTP